MINFRIQLLAVAILVWPSLPAGAANPPAPSAPGAVVSQPGDALAKALPSWLDLGAEVRGRGEHAGGISYEKGHRNSQYLHRLRLDMTVRARSWLSFSTEMQDSRVAGSEVVPAPASMKDAWELRFAHVDVGHPENGWWFRAGRQPLRFGSTRMVSTSNWGNVGPAFDGARLSLGSHGMRFDGFMATRVRAEDVEFDKFTTDRALWGFYCNLKGRPGIAQIEPYYFGVRNQLPGTEQTQFHTVGARLLDTFASRMDYEVEMAAQRGSVTGSQLGAWGGHWEIGYTTGAGRTAPRVFASYDYASGDAGEDDARVGTFQQLYPTHKWGTADCIAWRNIHEPVVGVTLSPARKWQVVVRFRDLWLADRNDAIYALSGAKLAQNPQATSSHVGEEFDFRVGYRPNAHLDFLAGYGRLFPGKFLEESTPGNPCTTAYLMWTFRI